MAKDYYAILGVPRQASRDEIKKAFHKLAHKYHPDKKGGDEIKFKEVNEAYQILSDDRKRAQYDAMGSAGFGGAHDFSGQGAAPGWDFSNFAAAENGFQFDLGDIFEDFFGGARTAKRRGRDISVDIEISFAESIFGATRKVLINKVGECDVCGGSGTKAGSSLKTCSACGGQGRMRESRRSFLGSFTTWRECKECQGSGKIPEMPCSACGGFGILKKTDEAKIVIPAGIQDGEMIRLPNKGEAVPRGVAGDLYVRIHVERHHSFRRDGANLLMELPIKLTDSLLGAEYAIKTLEGDEIKIKIPEGITYGEMLRVRGRGVPRKAGRGDLLIRIIIKIPTKLSKKAQDIIEDLKKEGL